MRRSSAKTVLTLAIAAVLATAGCASSGSTGPGSGGPGSGGPGAPSSATVVSDPSSAFSTASAPPVTGSAAGTGVALGSAAGARTSPATPSFAAFTGPWSGHDRILKVTAAGLGTESLGSGCCSPYIHFAFRLSNPRATTSGPVADLVITRVSADPGFTADPGFPRPKVGDTGRATIEGGVFTDTVTTGTYCDFAAGSAGRCGA